MPNPLSRFFPRLKPLSTMGNTLTGIGAVATGIYAESQIPSETPESGAISSALVGKAFGSKVGGLLSPQLDMSYSKFGLPIGSESQYARQQIGTVLESQMGPMGKLLANPSGEYWKLSSKALGGVGIAGGATWAIGALTKSKNPRMAGIGKAMTIGGTALAGITGLIAKETQGTSDFTRPITSIGTGVGAGLSALGVIGIFTKKPWAGKAGIMGAAIYGAARVVSRASQGISDATREIGRVNRLKNRNSTRKMGTPANMYGPSVTPGNIYVPGTMKRQGMNPNNMSTNGLTLALHKLR